MPKSAAVQKPARTPKSEPVWIVRELIDLPKPPSEGVVWHILYCNITSEAKAAWGLVDRGMGVYVPLAHRFAKPRNAPEMRHIYRPAFSRYIFLAMSERDSWWDVRQVEGIESVICNNLQPVKVSPVLMARLMKHEVSGGFDENPRPENDVKGMVDLIEKTTKFSLSVGDMVTLVLGPFRGMEGMVVKAPRSGRADATIACAQGTIRLPISMLMPTA